MFTYTMPIITTEEMELLRFSQILFESVSVSLLKRVAAILNKLTKGIYGKIIV